MKNRQRANADLFRRGVFNIEVARRSDDQRVLQSIGWLCGGGRCRPSFAWSAGNWWTDRRRPVVRRAGTGADSWLVAMLLGALAENPTFQTPAADAHERHGNIIPRCFLLDLCSVIEAPLTTLWRLSPNTVAGPLTDL